MVKVSIVGGSGYAGGELLRLVLDHPKLEVFQATSRKFLGFPLHVPHPNLRGRTDLCFTGVKNLKPCDVLFLSLPNGVSQKNIKDYLKLAPKIIDLGADFRLRSALTWHQWYKSRHQAENLLSSFSYGLPELNRKEISSSSFVAGPGCEAVVSLLCLYPLIKHGLVELKNIIIDAKMASSQAGCKPSLSSHHPERSGATRSYMPSGHRHTAEITQELKKYLKEDDFSVLISATAIEMVRGILATIHAFLKPRVEEKHVWQAFKSEYSNEPFVRIVKQKQGLYRYPEPKILQGTNICEVGFEVDKYSNRLVVLGAIDNLVKGTAGNGIQCLNLMLGFKESLGLEFSGLHPI